MDGAEIKIKTSIKATSRLGPSLFHQARKRDKHFVYVYISMHMLANLMLHLAKRRFEMTLVQHI